MELYIGAKEFCIDNFDRPKIVCCSNDTKQQCMSTTAGRAAHTGAELNSSNFVVCVRVRCEVCVCEACVHVKCACVCAVCV